MNLDRMEGLAGTASSAGAESLNTHLHGVHQQIMAGFPDIHRMAVALYDAPSAKLKTFVSSNANGHTLERHEVSLCDVPSLQTLANTHQVRVIDDMALTLRGSSAHTVWLRDQQFRSSLTIPVYQATELNAFFFFDSRRVKAFDAYSVRLLTMVADLVSNLYLTQMKLIRSMAGMVHLVSGLARLRDLETGQHLERMAQYAQLMAHAVASRHGLTDEFIEYVRLFAPLHDIGKIGIPDSVLLKPGPLNDDEWTVMRTHVALGDSLICNVGRDMALEGSLAFTVMRNVVSCHHERGDGSGYPLGLTLEHIPLEGRLIAIADVYDALSTRRPYKEPWSEDACIAELRSEASKGRLDGDCVEALIAARAQRLQIQASFTDAETRGGSGPLAERPLAITSQQPR